MANRLYRSDTDKMIGGVCGGLGEYLRLDPLILRILFVLLAMVNGLGLVAYVLLWIFVPVAHREYADREEMVSRNVEEIRDRAVELGQGAREAFAGRWNTQDRTASKLLIAGAVLVGVGLLTLLHNLGLLWWFSLGKLWPIVLIAIGAIILVSKFKRRR